MENKHKNVNNQMSHSINEIGDRINSLNVNDQPRGTLSGSSNTSPHNLASRGGSSPTQLGSSRLNPSAQEFVPRSTSSLRNSSQVTTNSTVSNNYSNGSAGVQSNNATETEGIMEDYLSLSYLKEFIHHISNKPSMYENGIKELTLIINSYIDEDECVIELIVNQIVDQSIIDVNFRYNGVRLCHHFMNHLRETASGLSFRQLLFRRTQRECSRKVSNTTSANTFVHLRGLALFTGELYSRCNEAVELADHLPNLLMNILSGDPADNIKCVFQVLKLCGQQLESHFASKDKEDFKNVIDRLREINASPDISTSNKNMTDNILKLADNNWVPPQTTATSNIVNPYLNSSFQETLLNNQPNDPISQSIYPSYNENLYDFGNGDELDDEVVEDFEKFLRMQQPN